MDISEFDYELPEELVAQQPLPQRDSSRMMVVDRKKKAWVDTSFSSLPDYVRQNDVLVINNTRVFPARLLGQRDPSGGRVEVLLVRQRGPLVWDTLVKPGARLKQGARLKFGDSRLRAEVLDAPGNGLRQLRFEFEGPWEAVLEEVGETPLPPYIKRPSGTSDNDRKRYQTVFARERGAVAAPTAGLHFTPEVIDRIRARNAKVVEITLHVGYGTFEPVRVDEVEQHRVAPEVFRIDQETAAVINETRSNGGRVVAIGTTTTRALESAVTPEGKIEAREQETALTITPGFKFQVANALLTNFHLPRSSLLLLVSAFGGQNFVLDAYRYAVAARFRFYSYGDCMFVI